MREQKKISTKDMILIGMFAAVIAVLSQIAIPMPSGVPVTLQTFAIALCGVVLGWKLAGAAVLVYLLIGAIGAPVFANFGAGLGVLFGKTGGFLIGFLFMAVLCGLSEKTKQLWVKGGLCLAGLLVCHLFGNLQFMLLTGRGFVESALLVSIPYLVKDVLSVVAAMVLGKAVRMALKRANVQQMA